MSALVAGHLFVGSIGLAHQVYRVLRPYRVGIYGPSLTGKTTLDQYLTVPGDIDPIPFEFRTTHPIDSISKQYKMPKAQRKLLRWKKDKKAISNADIGGQPQFRNLWIEDMFSRKVELVIYMIDHRVLSHPQFAMDAVAGFEYLVERMLREKKAEGLTRKAKKKSKKYRPKLFCILLNKMDIWWDERADILWQLNLKREHPLVYPFRNGLRKMRKAGIRAEIEAISAQHGLNVERVLTNLIDSL